jgi:L-lactate dehydrogenase complex protein LldG
MSDSRGEILAKIRTSRSGPYVVKNELGTIEDRLKNHPRNVVPARGDGLPEEQITKFKAEAELVNATVTRVSSNIDIPKEIAKYLADNNLPSRIKYAPSLEHLDWSTTLMEVSHGIGEATDEVCVTTAYAGVAETGTIVTYSGQQNPTTLNFLPPVHIAVLNAVDIMGSYEDVWTKLRADLGSKDQSSSFIPRTVNMITGPSRTGDIQQTLLLGIHGPQRLHIVIVDEKTS